MSSTDDKPPPLSIQDINNIITNLKNLLTSDCAEAEITVATNTAANSPTGNEQDGSNRTGNEQDGSNRTGNEQDGTNKQDGDANQAQETNDKKKEPLYELGKLCKELDYMIRSFQNLENLKNSLTEPFKTLEANVNDIVSDLEKDELRKQVQHNLRVFRNNITRVKILILLQLQAASINSDGNRALQTTFATGEAGDLPYLYRQPIFENSYYFKEIEEKYESLDDRQKLCLLCFSIFPENAEIKKRFLRFWWVGENLIPQNGNDEMGDLNDTLTTFVKKRLIEPVLKKNRLQPRSYKVTPIVRSCLIHFAKKAGFFDYDPDGKPIMDFSSCNKACMVKSERATASWFADYLKGNDKDGNSEKPKEQQQHQEQGKLSADLVKLQMLFNFLNKEKLISASQQIDKLQTLFNLSKQFPDLPTEWFSKMTGIKVLYLGRWEATAGQARHIEVEDIEFLKGFKNMKNLRLLSLQGISGIPKLPTTLCKLENLRILDLRACHDLEKLPERIGSLKKLTYLDLSECYLLDYIPQQLNKLSELQVLKGFVILDAKNSCTLDDLSELSSLRKLSVNVNTTKFNIDEAGDALAKFQKLEKLRIAWGWGGMPGKEDSTLDSSSEQQQSKTKKKQASSISSAAAKASTDKVNKGEEKGNRERSAVAAAGEANSKTAKLGGGLRGTANIALMAKKWRRLSMKGREPPKASRIPSKSCLVYTGFLVTTEYLFQMWGKQAGMFPGQKHSDLSLILGLRVYELGFWGVESALRGKVLVITACVLQYNVFFWLDNMPTGISNKGKWEEPCPLFLSAEDAFTNGFVSNGEDKPSTIGTVPIRQARPANSSWASLSLALSQALRPASSKAGGSEVSSGRKFSFGYFWGSTKEIHKWNRKRILALREERFETQKALLKIYLKFWIENMFNLLGLEINMIALLLASFALLNALSMLYIALVAACVLLNRWIIRKLWPVLVFLFASILILEYIAIWKSMFPPNQQSQTEIRCHDCWNNSASYFQYCRSCWLGLIIDDPRMLISYFLVFLLASFKLHADHSSYFSQSTYRKMMSQHKNLFVWRDLSFEMKSMWTFLDYVRLYCYCHLLDLVLVLILITGTLEYDILHLGYLAFALVFFRMRLEILKKKNKMFKFLRIYNFVVIVLSLAYQSPFVGEFSSGKCNSVNYIYDVIGFYKYDYGFRINTRSVLVEIIIFMLVSLQSYMFSSQESDYVSRYLEAEQIGAIVREQEKKAAWKTAQLQQSRESEEKKHQRNVQVEKMKSEMLNLQIQLHNMNSIASLSDVSPDDESLQRSVSLTSNRDIGPPDKEESTLWEREQTIKEDIVAPPEAHACAACIKGENPEVVESPKNSMEHRPCEITEIEHDADHAIFDTEKRGKSQSKDNPLISAVHLLGDGVSQVQSIGNQAVNNLVNFLNIKPDDSDMNEHSSVKGEAYDETESQKMQNMNLNRSSSLQSDKISNTTSLQLGRILCHIWSQMQSNNNVVCYCLFVLVFLWNFGLLSMVYLAALFLYALCVNNGPTYIFWVIMLIYTEAYILFQYMYQIAIQHCGLSINSDLLRNIGFPTCEIKSSFVVCSLPLFLVYLFTLIQSSISAKDGEWMFSTDFNFHRRSSHYRKEVLVNYSWSKRVSKLLQYVINRVKQVTRRFFWYWKSLIQGAETPPYFVQLSMDVHLWPDDGVQPERVESGINRLLEIVHDERCTKKISGHCPFASRVQVQSIKRSQENQNVALIVFEVVYASRLTGCTSADWYKSLTPAADVAKEIRKAKHAGLVEEMGFPYQILSAVGGGKREFDLYAYIFVADLTVFFLVAMFYQSLIKNNSEILNVYQLEDQFPIEFVIILMIIFFLIVVDRVLYLCSFAAGKVIFYLFNLVLFTYSITRYAWRMKPSDQHAGKLALRAIFLAKAISLALQGVQIRHGIPQKATLYWQFLTSKVSRINYLGYRLYRALPFLYELRCVLDWSCTTTSLTMYDWLKLEDINASLYLVKCDALLNRATHRQGEKQKKMTKCCNGICLFFILICVIWAPMLMYSSGNPTNIANPINDASFQLDISTGGGRLTLYQTTLCEKLQWDNLNSDVNFDAYNKNDIQLICCQADATILWLVSDVVQRRFIEFLDWDMDMVITSTWLLTRERPKGKEVVKYEKPVDSKDLPEPSDVQKVFNGSTISFRIYNLYPRYFRVTGSGEVRSFEQEVTSGPISVSADLVINRAASEWWSFHDLDSSHIRGCGGLTGPTAVIVSEETPPQGILGDTLSKFSIWGLYITFVLAVGRFIRLQCSDLRMRIPFENLPSCDRLIAICENIYAARAEGELGVEEVLYWTLVKIYRSPHMLLEYTKPD